MTCYQRSARMHGARPGVSPTLAGQGGAHGRLDGSLRDPQWDAGYPLRSPESTGSRSRRRRPEAELGGLNLASGELGDTADFTHTWPASSSCCRLGWGTRRCRYRGSAELYELLVSALRWSPERYGRFAAQAMIAALLPPTTPTQTLQSSDGPVTRTALPSRSARPVAPDGLTGRSLCPAPNGGWAVASPA